MRERRRIQPPVENPLLQRPDGRSIINSLNELLIRNANNKRITQESVRATQARSTQKNRRQE
ncbi:hypothetical protein [Achromobacter aegrifaciens]|uniref:hypothetical protein n=1 Tax=Achromobacter aegrifaciens TaxID=1287736 RepID=UPI001583F7C2|nr:hypothetical protein [Achromobacter aegrifaciens]